MCTAFRPTKISISVNHDALVIATARLANGIFSHLSGAHGNRDSGKDRNVRRPFFEAKVSAARVRCTYIDT